MNDSDTPQDEGVELVYKEAAGKPLLAQFARIDRLADTHEHVFDVTTRARESVSDELREKLHFAVDITDEEAVVLSLGLQLVGFFAEGLADAAAALGARVRAAEIGLTDEEKDEWREAITNAHDRLDLEEAASRFGMTVDEFLGVVGSEAAEEGDEDGEEPPPTLAGSRFHGSNLN